MIYLVSKQQQLFESEFYKEISLQEAKNHIASWDKIQFDTETDSLDCFLGHLLSAQFGNKKAGMQIVVDCTTIDIKEFKDLLESKMIVGHNLKFDLQWLYKYGIIPRAVYDTMIVEQLLYLGFPHVAITPEEYHAYGYDFPYLEEVNEKTGRSTYILSYSLKAVSKKYLGIEMDKTVRGEIIYKGLTERTILYAGRDVEPLEDIAKIQMQVAKERDCVEAVKLECRFVPVNAYLEFCGIKLDETAWKAKMDVDQKNKDAVEKELYEFVIKTPKLSKYVHVDLQGDLFNGFNSTPKVNINWNSPSQVVDVLKILGFKTTTQDKKTGEDKDTALEKELVNQRGINDEFLDKYLKYKEYSKVVSSFGQGHLNAIHPITGRIHTTFRQLGCASGRMSSGSSQSNEAIAKAKGLKADEVSYPNLQQLPANAPTRSSFVAEKGNLFISCDYSAMEGRLAADIYEDEAMIEDFLHGTKDSHSLFAWMIFRKECEACGCKSVFDVKSKAPHLRKRAKPVEFAYLFGAAAPTIAKAANCTVAEAQQYIDSLDKGFKGLAKFVKEGTAFVKKHGYVLMNKYTGHKMYWWDHNKWLEDEASYQKEGFWEEYRSYHKPFNDSVAKNVRAHFQAAGKWSRMARNSCTQGTGANIVKLAAIRMFNWILMHNLFGKVKLVCMVHDEMCFEFPEYLTDFPKLLEKTMELAAEEYCKSVPIPAEASVDKFWVH